MNETNYNYVDPLKTHGNEFKNSFGNFDYINSLNDSKSVITKNARDEIIKTNPLVFSLNSNNPFKSSHINSTKFDEQKLKQVAKLAFPTTNDLSDKDMARKRAIKVFMGMGRKTLTKKDTNSNELNKLKYLNMSGLIPDDLKKKGNKLINIIR